MTSPQKYALLIHMNPFARLRRAAVHRDYWPPSPKDYEGTGLSRDELTLALRVFKESRRAPPSPQKLHASVGPVLTYDQMYSILLQIVVEMARKSIHMIFVPEVPTSKTDISGLVCLNDLRYIQQHEEHPAPPEFKHVVFLDQNATMLAMIFILIHEAAHVFLGHVSLRYPNLMELKTYEEKSDAHMAWEFRALEWLELSIDIELEAELAALLALKRIGFNYEGPAHFHLHHESKKDSELPWQCLRKIGSTVNRLGDLLQTS